MNKLLLINTITSWNEPPRARHQLAFALARINPVIFVARNETGPKNINVQEVQKNITLITPSFPIDYRFRYRIPVVNEIYQDWLFHRIKELYPDVVVINFDFTAHRIFSYFKPVIYYCNDEYIGNSKYPSILVNLYHRFCEKRVIFRSLFNISTSAYLTRKLKAINQATYEIPLGVTPVQLPSGYNGISEPRNGRIRVGLMGVINERQISIDLVNEISSVESFHLILIGPIEDGFTDKLRHAEKITFTGMRKGQELIDELMKIDVGIAVYNMGRVNPGATPNKLWQYLSVGKPVVISKMPNLAVTDFPENSVFLFDGMTPVVELINQSYNQNTSEAARERILFASRNTWDHRAEKFIEILKNFEN